MARVWIDQDACTSSALCEVAVPDVFVLSEQDDLAYVKQDGVVLPGRGAEAKAEVHEARIDAVGGDSGALEAVGQLVGELNEGKLRVVVGPLSESTLALQVVEVDGATAMGARDDIEDA